MEPQGVTVTRVRRVYAIARRHNRRRRMTPNPHPHQWGCDLTCFGDGAEDAVLIACQIGWLIRTPRGTYVTGHIKP